MKYAVIDIGSNSVRLMISDGVETLYKKVNTTKLAEGMGEERILTDVAVLRTATAVSNFYFQAVNEKVSDIYVFATAAVRQASNAKVFTDKVKELCGAEVDVVLGKDEAELGYIGALNGKDGGVIDVGGASSEIIVVKNGKIEYSHSINLGAVKIKDECGQDFELVSKMTAEKIKEYGSVPKSRFYAIGGTATTLVAVELGLEPYNPTLVDGFIFTKQALSNLTDKLFSLSVEERQKLKGMFPPRAEVIACGAKLLLDIVNMLGVEEITVSERDNLEGYLIKRLKENE
ncbi:MAG: hypothetical protein J6U92_04740 [Clostridia bacterium]|nr:hypothetical protein [Clostridia bacterium]